MTAREWMEQNHPDRVDEGYIGGVDGCPYEYYINVPKSDECDCGDCEETCSACWDQEIPGTENEKENETMITMEVEAPKTTKKNKAQLLEELENLKKELTKLEKYRKYDDTADELYAIMDSFTRAGFTREEAFTMMMTAMKMAYRS